MQRFFALLLILFLLTGCTKEQPREPDGGLGPAAPTLGIPLPTPEMLAALGPENDIPLRHFLPDTLFAAVGKPKQFLDSPACTGGEWFAANVIVQRLQLYDLNPNSIERFIQASGFPLPAIINVPNPQDPMAVPQQRVIPILRRVTVITFNAPVDKLLLISSILRTDVDPAALETQKRTESKSEYYDLTPPNQIIPARVALGMLDERTAIIVEGVEADIKAVFSGSIPKNAVLDRLKHTPVDTNELTILTSLEGLDLTMEALDQSLKQIGEIGNIPPSVLTAIREHLRALTFSVNVSAASGQPAVTLYAEGRNEESAEAIGTAVRGLIIHAQTALATMNENTRQMLPVPPDFAASLLKEMSVEVKGNRVTAVLNNFETLMPMVNKWLSDRQTAIQQDIEAQQRMEQLGFLAEIFTAYYREHGKFPADILDADGKPLLSWRVVLLPMIGLGELYKQFKLDEPWDSETNKEAANSMPFVFQPLLPDVVPPKTVVRFFDSPGTPLSNRELKLEELPSPQETVLFVMVSPEYAVEWTKPEPLEFDIDKLADIAGERFLGITFAKQIVPMQVLPATDPQYDKWKQAIEAMVKGTPLNDGN